MKEIFKMISFIILSNLLLNTTKYKAYSEKLFKKRKDFFLDLRVTARSTHNSFYLPTYPYTRRLYHFKQKLGKPLFHQLYLDISEQDP